MSGRRQGKLTHHHQAPKGREEGIPITGTDEALALLLEGASKRLQHGFTGLLYVEPTEGVALAAEKLKEEEGLDEAEAFTKAMDLATFQIPFRLPRADERDQAYAGVVFCAMTPGRAPVPDGPAMVKQILTTAAMVGCEMLSMVKITVHDDATRSELFAEERNIAVRLVRTLQGFVGVFESFLSEEADPARTYPGSDGLLTTSGLILPI